MTKTARYFLGSEIRQFLKSDKVKDYVHHYFEDENEIVFEKLIFLDTYDLADRGFGYFAHEADKDFDISFLSLFRFWKYHNNSREILTRNDKRVDILLALFGDGQERSIRNLSDDEKEFILDNRALKVEIFINLENFADRLTQKNKSWLNTLFYGREIKRGLSNFSLGK